MKEIEIIQEDIIINVKERDILSLIDDMISFIASYNLQDDLVSELAWDYDIKKVDCEE